MTRHPGARGPIRTAARVFPPEPERLALVRAFVARTLGDTHACRPDAMLLTGELADAARAPVAVVVRHAPRWAYVTVRPVGRTGAPSAGFGGRRAAGIVAGLEARSARWGLTRERGGSAVWFELDATVRGPGAARRPGRSSIVANDFPCDMPKIFRHNWGSRRLWPCSTRETEGA